MIAPVDVTDIYIETERLILRAWTFDDLDDFYAYASVDGVGQMAGWMPHESKEVSRAILNSFIQGKKTLAVVHKDSGRVIGSIGIEPRDDALDIPQELKGRELGYVLSKAYWGRGLMPEAVSAVMDYCFTVLEYDFLTCGHFTRNSQSRRVIEKCGFHYLSEFNFTTRIGTVEPTRMYICFAPRKTPLDPLEEQLAGVKIETPRLILRNFRPEDAVKCFSFLSDGHTCEQNGFEPFSTMDWEYWWLMEKYHGQKGRFMVCLQGDDDVIGTINVIQKEGDKAEIGYTISPAFCRNGYGFESVRAMIDYLFSHAAVGEILAETAANNMASVGLLSKLGFNCVKSVNDGFALPGNKFTDMLIFSLEK